MRPVLAGVVGEDQIGQRLLIQAQTAVQSQLSLLAEGTRRWPAERTFPAGSR
jgi:hypothetical protein